MPDGYDGWMEASPTVDLARPIRPQGFGRTRPTNIDDPIVEPMWPGLRVIAAVGAGNASLFDEDGDPIEEHEDLCTSLAGGLSGAGNGAILDGYLTKQVVTDQGGTYTWVSDYPTMAGQMQKMFIGGRRFQAEDIERMRAADIEAVTFADEDLVNLVIVDLLWLDGQWLLDVPLLERKRVLESVLPGNELVRTGPFVRPPLGTWIGSWRAQGFRGLTFKAANSRYRPGETAADWSTAPMPRR